MNDCKYNGLEKIKEHGDLIHYTTNIIEEDETEKIKMFAYIIEQPYSKLSYQIYDIDLLKGTEKLLHEFISSNGFIQTTTFDFPKKDHKYRLVTQLKSLLTSESKFNEADLNLRVHR